MNEQEQQIRIAIVDDHEMFRAGVIATLQPHFDIVGQASDVEGSVAMIAQTKPNVVLLDVHVPGGKGGGGAALTPEGARLLRAYDTFCARLHDAADELFQEEFAPFL